MVPSAFVALERWPLTSSGKLDRRALPQPALESYVISDYEAPEGELESAVAEIWQALLRVDRVGRYDNFFELGGNSLSAMQMMGRIRSALLIEVPLGALFEFPTVRQLSTHLDGLREAQLAELLADPKTRNEGLWAGTEAISESQAS
jgi:acyl carrier protein